MKDLRKIIVNNERIIGTFCSIVSPHIIEIFGSSEFEFIGIDAEHSQIGRETIEELVRAGDAVGKPVVIRVPTHESDWIASSLDAGCAGIVVPRIETADQARAAVSAFRYPPAGRRGCGPGRATGYGQRLPQYLQNANDSLLLALMIETADGMANLDEILAVPGFDAVLIGPGDLAISLGALGPQGKPRLDAAIAAIVDRCTARQVAVGTFVFDATQVGAAVDQGMTLLVVGADTVFMQRGLALALEEMGDARPRRSN